MINKSDKDLMHDFQNGDVDAFAEIYRRHKQGLWLYCLKMIGNQDEASDVFQDIMAKIINKKELFNGIGSVAGWLFTIARNQCINYRSRKKNYLSVENLGLNSPEDLELDQEHQEQCQLISLYIDKLPEAQREAILLHDVNGFSYSEIASISDSTIETIRMRVYRARQQLRNWLEPILFPDKER